MPHEKHTTDDQSRRPDSRGGGSNVDGPTGSKFCINTSISVKPDFPGGTGCTGRSFPIRRCIKSSNSEGIGATYGGDIAGDSNSSWAAGVISSAPPGRSSPAFIYRINRKGPPRAGVTTHPPPGPPDQHDSPTPGTKCQWSAQLSCPAINRSRTNRRRVMWPISPKAFMANVSNSIANIDGSVPATRVIFSNCRR